MTANVRVTACVFDAYGTLFDVHSPLAAVAAELGDKGPAISELWRAKQLQYSWLRSLMGRYVDFAEITADALDYALAVHGIAERALRERLLELYRSLPAHDDAARCLAMVRDMGVRTGILSNGSPAMLGQAVASANLGALLDYVLSVDTVRTYKPSPEVYQLAVNAFGAERHAIAFVSGNGWDCAGAAAFGFKVIHVNRSSAVEERLGIGPRTTVANLTDAANELRLMLAEEVAE
jgi:2-haloacid dehalogenase